MPNCRHCSSVWPTRAGLTRNGPCWRRNWTRLLMSCLDRVRRPCPLPKPCCARPKRWPRHPARLQQGAPRPRCGALTPRATPLSAWTNCAAPWRLTSRRRRQPQPRQRLQPHRTWARCCAPHRPGRWRRPRMPSRPWPPRWTVRWPWPATRPVRKTWCPCSRTRWTICWPPASAKKPWPWPTPSSTAPCRAATPPCWRPVPGCWWTLRWSQGDPKPR